MADIQNISKIKTPAGEHELNSKYWNGKEITDVKTINGESIFDSGDINTNLVEITYLELKKLRNSSKLIPGIRYRITDYNTTTVQENTMSVNNPFDIIVTAINTNTLSEDAKVSYSNRDEEIITSRVYTWKDINNWISGGGNNIPSEISSVTDVLSHQLGTTSYAADEYVRVEFVGDDQYSNPIKALGVALYQNGTLIDVEYGPKKAYYMRIPSSGSYALYFYACGVNSDLSLGQCGVVIDKCSKIPYYYKNMLNDWDIKYCLDNDTERFAWADRINGKGVIHYMKDEFGNEAYYDFKNIKFNCSVFENYPFEYAYTFSDVNGNDLSLSAAAHENKIKPYVTSGLQKLNHTVFIGSNIHSNTLDENNQKNIIWVNGCYYNNIGNGFRENNIASRTGENLINFHNNTIGNLFKNNKIQASFSMCRVGNNTTSCEFHAPVEYNEIGNNSWHINVHYPISYCKFGSYIQYCVFNNNRQSSVSEMKWCTFGDGLEGAQYIPCCQKVTFEDRCLYNTGGNWYISDVILKDGSKLIDALIEEHDDRLYVCRVDGGCDVFKYKDLHTLEENLESTKENLEESIKLNAIKPIYSNPNLDFDSGTNNGDYYGYVGNLYNLNVFGDNILIDSISVYVREGRLSPNLKTPVWCRLMKYVNDNWEIIYQSEKSKTIEGIQPENLFTFKMVSKSDNPLLKTSDKIAIVYVSSENDGVLSGVDLGFKTINKNGGLTSVIANDSQGTAHSPAFVFGYMSMASETSELCLGKFSNIDEVSSKAAEIDICTNQNITRMSFKIDNSSLKNANGYIEQFITGGPYTVEGIQLYYITQILHNNGEVSSRQIVYKIENGVKVIHNRNNWGKFIDFDYDNNWNNKCILYSRGSETVDLESNQTITGRKRFDNDIDLGGKTIIKNEPNGGGRLKIYDNNAGESQCLSIGVNGVWTNNIPKLEITTGDENNVDTHYTYKFPQLEKQQDDIVVVKSQLDKIIQEQQVLCEEINCFSVHHPDVPTDAIVSIDPNKYYKIFGAKSLKVTFNYGTGTKILNNYMFEVTFDGGSTLTLPDGIKWANGVPPTCEPLFTYQISIINNLGVFTCFGDIEDI